MASAFHSALLAFSIIFLQHTATLADKNSYVVYLGMHSHGLAPTELDARVATQSHYDLLRSVLGSYKKAKESMLYSYNKYINGFVAKLTKEEARRIKTFSNVLSVFENRQLKLHTTRSWEFLGLEQNGVTTSNSLWNHSGYGADVIIGTLDSGVWPESKSFNDQGFGQIPSRWKGVCMAGEDQTFKCNKKLIGARYFYIENDEPHPPKKPVLSPRDHAGHGTHTLSTAGGSFVNNVSFYGLGSGTAKGGSPKARVAAYKVCWGPICTEANILAGFEAAIGDGVDVLSISLGSDEETDYKSDSTAIGSFHAVRQGITVVASAGNDGPTPSTVENTAPWIFTIGASTSDRAFYNRIYLGNSTLIIKGASIGLHNLPSDMPFHPLIDAASAPRNASTADKARFCQEGSLDSSKVKGKIVVCQNEQNNGSFDRIGAGIAVKDAGGVGMIFFNDAQTGDDASADSEFIFASHISYEDGLAVLDYINKTANPTAYISNGVTELGAKPAPMMASFSSRGPSSLYPQILKPDIIAPGVNVIAAYIEDSPSDDNYTIMSGTSMSCPHVAGIAGLLKSLHPDWSPAAIRSAIMTTATTFDNNNETILDSNKQHATPFGYGAGHINPNSAASPGLIYNLTESDYLDFLCSIYTERDLKVFAPISYKCKSSKSVLNFNYPSISVSNFTTSTTLKRILTNVGESGTYHVKVKAPPGVHVNVVPLKLEFNQIGEEQMFSVELKANNENSKHAQYVFGSLIWSDGTHNVRSPIVVGMV